MGFTPIPISPIGRAAATEHKNFLKEHPNESTKVAGSPFYIQAHPLTLGAFSSGNCYKNFTYSAAFKEYAVLFRYHHYATSVGLPAFNFPNNILKCIEQKDILIAMEDLSNSKIRSMTSYLQHVSFSIATDHKMIIIFWILYFSPNFFSSIVCYPVFSNCRIPIGKVFLNKFPTKY